MKVQGRNLWRTGNKKREGSAFSFPAPAPAVAPDGAAICIERFWERNSFAFPRVHRLVLSALLLEIFRVVCCSPFRFWLAFVLHVLVVSGSPSMC